MDSENRKPTSQKQIAANRRNAELSTGPTSREGKEAVKLNALKHGLLAQEVLLPGEDSEVFQELSQWLYNDLRPEGAIETTLVERIVAGYWRLLRLQRVEAGVFENEIAGAERDRKDQDMSPTDRRLRDLDGQPAPSAEERRQAVSNADVADLGAAFVRDANSGNAFSKLSRYEVSIERSLLSNLHELQRLQSMRLDGVGTPPVAADLNVVISGQ
jgi:hypothetical protein